MTKLEPLKKGDKISIIAPGYGDCEQAVFDDAIKEIERHGYTAKFTEGLISDIIPYHANTDEFRANDLYRALCDEETQAVWCLKGGYGSGRLIPIIKDKPKPKTPKFIAGFSDITCLHLFMHQNWGMTCIHGANANNGAQLSKYEYINYSDVHDIIAGKKSETSLNFSPVNNHRENLKGELTGGNLMLCTNSIGTAWEINTHNKIVIFEDIDEQGYQIDRSLNHMQQAGLFDNVKAVVFGDFGHEKIKVDDDNCDFAINRFAASTPFPVVRVKDIGHLKTNRAFVYKSIGGINFDTNKFTF